MNNIEKTIFNSLASGKGINLPGVGTLYIGRQGAEFLDKGRVRPPQNKVFFSEGNNPAFGTVDKLPEYDKWLSEAKQMGDVLEINGVGILRGGVFYPSVELHLILNPNGNEPVKAVHRTTTGKKVSVGLMVIGAAALVLWLVVSIDFWSRKDMDATQNVIAYEEQRDASARGESTIAPAIAAEAEEDIEDKSVQAEVVKEQSTEDVIQKQLESFASGETVAAKTYFLVVGVFENSTNADKLITTDPLKIGSGNYSKMPFGDKTLVSAYSSNDKSVVEKRRRELSAIDETLWVYERTKK